MTKIPFYLFFCLLTLSKLSHAQDTIDNGDISSIEEFHYNENFQEEDYWICLDKAETVAINGLDGYALPSLLDRFNYAKPDKEVSSKL